MNLTRNALAAGLLALLTVAPAAAQQFPTVPAQSIIGRLGLPGSSGPSQAIPLTTLAPQIGAAILSKPMSIGVAPNQFTLRNSGGAFSLVNTAGTLEFTHIDQTGNATFGGTVTSNAVATSFIDARGVTITPIVGSGPSLFAKSTSAASDFLWFSPAPTPRTGKFTDGSNASPITAINSPTVLIERREAVGAGGGDGSSGAALSVFNSATGTTQGVAISGQVLGSGAAGDVVGLYGSAWSLGTTGAAFGGFLSSRASNVLGGAIGLEIEVINDHASDVSFSPIIPLATPLVGIDLSNSSPSGSFVSQAAIVIRTDSGQWDRGIAFMQGGHVKTALISENDTSATSVLLSQGTHTNGIDLRGGTFSGLPFASTGFNVGNAGTVTISSGTASAINTSQSITGTTSTNCAGGSFQFPCSNLFAITADNIDATTPSTAFDGWQFNHSFGGSSLKGARQSVDVISTFTAASNASNGNRNYGPLVAQMNVLASDGGTGLTPSLAKGVFFGGNFVVRGNPTNALGITGIEVDLNVAGSQVMRGAFSAVSEPTTQGTTYDFAFGVQAAGGTGNIGWKAGVLFTSLGGRPGLDAAGCAICTDGATATIGNIIDFSSYTVTGYILRGPATVAFIDGNSNGGLSTLLLGTNRATSGVLVLNGSSTGAATFVTQAAQGTPNLTIPTASGTLVASAASPLVVSATTGQITCPTCSTTSGGGAIATLAFGTHLTSGGASYNGSVGVTITSDATNTNTASTIVARDGSGNFTAGTITASLTGHASLDCALTGCTMSGAIAMGTSNITGVGNVAATTFNGNTLTTGTGTLTLGSVTLNAGAGGTLGSNAFTSTAYAPIASPTFTGTATIPTLAATTINAFTLAGTISGGGNNINNVVIGASTPLAGTFTVLTGTSGTLAGLTGLAIRDTSAAFDVTIAGTSSAALTAGRTLTLNMGNVAHTLALGTTANTITFPNAASDTVAMLGVANTFTGAQTISNAAGANLLLSGNSTPQVGFTPSAGATKSAQFYQQGDVFNVATSGVGSWFTVELNAGQTKVLASTASTSVSTGSFLNAGGFGNTGAIYAGAEIATGATVVGSLPTCNAAHKAARHFVTDANATTFNSTAAGGGANNMPVTCNGTNWILGANDNDPLQQMRKFA